MIQRRKFLESALALSAFGALGANGVSAQSQARSSAGTIQSLQATGFSTASKALDWSHDIIQTQRQSNAQRRPVVTGVSLQPNGDLLAIVGDDHYVSLYSLGEKKFVEHINAHTDWVRSTQFSPDGQQLVTAGNDRTIQIWDVGNWDDPAVMKHHTDAVIELAFTPDGSRIATVGFEKTLTIHDTKTGGVVKELNCACADNHAVAYSPDGRLLAAGGRCGTIRVWDTKSWERVSAFKAHRKRIRSLSFTENNVLVSAADDQFVRVTLPRDPEQTLALPRLAAKLYSTALLPGGIIATSGSDNKIHLWKPRVSVLELPNATAQMPLYREIGVLTGHTGTVSCLTTANGKLASGSYDTQVRLWTVETGDGLRHTKRMNQWAPKLK